MWIDLPATFRKIFQDIFSSFEFGLEFDSQDISLLGGVVCNHIYRLAFNLCNLWESTLKFMRKLYRGRKRVGSINYNLIRDVSYEYSKIGWHTPFLPIITPYYQSKNQWIDQIEMTRTARGDDGIISVLLIFAHGYWWVCWNGFFSMDSSLIFLSFCNFCFIDLHLGLSFHYLCFIEVGLSLFVVVWNLCDTFV